MSYWTISVMSTDLDLAARVRSCAAQEGIENPGQWTAEHMLALAAQPGWDAAWESALASGVGQPGRQAGVVTDGQILSAVQMLHGQDTEPPA